MSDQARLFILTLVALVSMVVLRIANVDVPGELVGIVQLLVGAVAGVTNSARKAA